MNQTKNTHFSLLLPALILVALVINLWILFGLNFSDSNNSFEELDITFLTAPDCTDCFSLEAFENYFEQNDVQPNQMKEVVFSSLQGKYLVNKYNITQVPTVIVNGSVADYEFMQGLVDSIGEIKKNAFVVTELQPPYLDLEEDRIVGEYSAIYLDDSTCDECYDVSAHDIVFERLAMKATDTRVIDISSEEGQELANKYFISAIPTILLTGELDVYEGLQQIWPSVGSVEEDGTYVLRKGVEQMGAYKVIPEGDIVIPEQEEAEVVQ